MPTNAAVRAGERLTNMAKAPAETFGGIPLAVDHIFASDFFESQAGVWQQPEISDHAAVWAILSFDDTK